MFQKTSFLLSGQFLITNFYIFCVGNLHVDGERKGIWTEQAMTSIVCEREARTRTSIFLTLQYKSNLNFLNFIINLTQQMKAVALLFLSAFSASSLQLTAHQ